MDPPGGSPAAPNRSHRGHDACPRCDMADGNTGTDDHLLPLSPSRGGRPESRPMPTRESARPRCPRNPKCSRFSETHHGAETTTGSGLAAAGAGGRGGRRRRAGLSALRPSRVAPERVRLDGGWKAPCETTCSRGKLLLGGVGAWGTTRPAPVGCIRPPPAPPRPPGSAATACLRGLGAAADAERGVRAQRRVLPRRR